MARKVLLSNVYRICFGLPDERKKDEKLNITHIRMRSCFDIIPMFDQSETVSYGRSHAKGTRKFSGRNSAGSIFARVVGQCRRWQRLSAKGLGGRGRCTCNNFGRGGKSCGGGCKTEVGYPTSAEVQKMQLELKSYIMLG